MNILQNLMKLQGLEFDERIDKAGLVQAAELRTTIPEPILGHYDRLRTRGKKGIAEVRNQVCSGCHMGVPIGMITTLMRGADVQLCENCGRYLYLPEPVESPEPAAEVPVEKPVRKPRKRKPVAHAV
jgi:predicted  nucleic acid-binding Zn-ribbon protein